MPHLLLFIYLTAILALTAQKTDPWVKFTDPESRLAGFKDLSGTIRIPAKFENYSVADTFHNIVAVREPVGKTYESYYLLKNGTKAGVDSLYLYDGYDCESDGMIIYKNHNTGYLGYLDINGAAVIPAVYNYATGFRNGWAQALVNAKKRCWEADEDTADCDHLIWEGGTQVLINKQNEILAEGLASDFFQTVDWHSALTNQIPKDTSIYVKVDGRNGTTYYFIQYEKEFRKWFFTEFLPGVAADKRKFLFPEIMIWDEKKSWRSVSQDEFMKSYSTVLTSERFKTSANRKMSFGRGEFSEHLMTSPIYRKFFTACGKFDRYRYPFFLVTMSFSQKNGVFDRSESFEFIRTAQGFRLLQSPITPMP